jgi:hypothetical protein
MTSRGWLTAADIAERLKISRSSAFTLMRKLPRLKVGRITRVSEAELATYIAANLVPGRPGRTAIELERERDRQAPEWALQDVERLAARTKVRPTRPRRSGPLALPPDVPKVRLTRPRVRKPV